MDVCAEKGGNRTQAAISVGVSLRGEHNSRVGPGIKVGALLVSVEGAIRRVAPCIPLHVCALNAAGIALLPAHLHLPFFESSLSLIAERMSPAQAVAGCVLLARVQPSRCRSSGRHALHQWCLQPQEPHQHVRSFARPRLRMEFDTYTVPDLKVALY